MAGPMRSGKTSLVQSMMGIYTKQPSPTIGADVNVLHLKTGEHPSSPGVVRLLVYDISGSPHFSSVACAYYKMADFFFLVFDASDRDSFRRVADFRARTSTLRPGAYAFLVGNKADRRANEPFTSPLRVSREEGEKKAAEWGIPYFEVSAKHETGVRELFAQVCAARLVG